MTATNRFRIVAPLPSPRGHLHVAVDRASRPPRAVVLAFYPRALSDDPVRLERLSGEMERAARLAHPNVVAPLGIEVVGDDLAAVTVWRDAVTLREVLDAGGRLPSDIAARIAADVCAGLAHAHGRAEPVVHGLLRPEAVLVDESGTAAVSGFGMPGGSGISDDLLGVGELLHECLAGAPPEHPSAPLDAHGIPPSLAAVVNEARAQRSEARLPTAEALGKAIAEAVPLAPRAEVAGYVEAIVPAGMGLRAQRRRRIEAALDATRSARPEEVSDEDIVCVPTPAPGATSSSTSASFSLSTSIGTPIPTSTDTANAPSPAGHEPARGAFVAGAPARDGTAPTSPVIAAPAAAPTHHQAGAGCDRPVHRDLGTARGRHVSLRVAVGMALGGAVFGFALARLAPWSDFSLASVRPTAEARASADAPASAPVASVVPGALDGPPEPAAPRPATRPAKKKAASVRRPAALEDGKTSRAGLIDVTVPDGAEVWLDGRRIGTGSTRRRIAEGAHRVEVRHGGAKVGESFHVASGETWTYVVTPR